MAKKFASQGDMSEKTISFTEIGRDLWAFTAEGDPNTGVIIGDDSVMVIDAQATPRLADMVVEKIRTVTDKPIKHVVLSHYHAVREACDPKFSDYAIYEHCMPFNVARAFDEAKGIDTPRIWTAERDMDMWNALQNG